MHLFRTNENDGGVAIVEYALIVGVIALLSVSAVTLVGEGAEATFTDVAEAVDTGSSSESGSVEAPSDSPGGESDDQGSGGQDDQNQDDQNQDDESDDEQNDSDDESDGDDAEPEDETQPADEQGESQEVTEVSVPSVANTDTSAEWNRKGRSRNYDGVWEATVEFANGSGQTQFLTVVVTTVDEDGTTETETVEGFEVPANGSADFTHGGNEYAVTGNGSKKSGTERVEIQVVSVTTTGPYGEVHTVDVDSEPVGLEVPTP